MFGPPSAPAQVINTSQPAGRIEEFFHALATCKELPTRDEALRGDYTHQQKLAMMRLFEAHGMILTGPPLVV